MASAFTPKGTFVDGRYELEGLVPDETECASCMSQVFDIDGQKRLHLLTGCNCYVAPYVCSTCRHRNDGNTVLPTLRCKWCLGFGVPKSFIRQSNKSVSARAFGCRWFETRMKYQHDRSNFLKRILKNWNLTMHYRNFVTNFFGVNGQIDLPIINPNVLKITFFKSWLSCKRFQNSGEISVYYDKMQLNAIFLRMLENVTFARMLICNLFCESKNTRFFTGRRNLIKTKVEIMSIVFHRLLSNFARIFEILLQLR